MALVSAASVREVRSRADIVQVVGEFVTLKRAGTRFKGLCPFHNEKTPSFTVNQEQGFFHCFGCGEHGDSIGFLQKHNGLTFVEAVEQLASQVGVELRYEGGNAAPRKTASERELERRKHRAMQDATHWAMQQFQSALMEAPKDSPIWRYIAERNLSDEIVKAFCLGYAPDEWAHLSVLLQKQGRGHRVCEALGLITPRKNGQGYYDRFRNRLMFPVFDITEKPIGFGGRILPSDDDNPGAKYINSPDSDLYTKGDILFGLAQAKKSIRDNKYAVLVEGNIDVLMMHQAGFTMTVAPMGTALTPAQVRLLRRFSDEVVLLYDGDTAGQAAAIKSIPLLLESDIHGRIVVMPPGEDPDTFLQEKGADALSEAIRLAQPAMEFLIDDANQRNGLTDRGRARTLRELQPLVQKIQDFREKQLVIARLSSALNLPERRIIGMLRSKESVGMEEPAAPDARESRQVTGTPREMKLAKLCLQHPSCLSWLEDVDGQSLVMSEGLRRILWEAITLLGEEETLSPAVLMERLEEPGLRAWVAAVFCEESEVLESDAQAVLEDCVALMRREKLLHESRELTRALEDAQRRGDTETVRELIARKVQLNRERTR